MQKKNILKSLCVGIAGLVFASFTAEAQWQNITNNLPGPVVTDNVRPIETDGTRLYVRGAKGVYVSSDNGNSFTAVNAVTGASYSLTNMTLRFIKYVNGYLWVGSDPGSGAINFGYATLHRLVPGQSSWEKCSTGFPVGDTANVADDISYDASTGTYYVASSLGGAYVSTNGTSWVQRTSGLGGTGVPSSVLAFNGAAYEVRPLAQVYKTTNQGANWTALSSHPGTSPGYLIQTNGRIMFSTTGNTTPQDGLYYTDDLGATWKFSTGIRGLLLLTQDANLIYGAGVVGSIFGSYGFKFSATQGTSWDDLPTNGLPMNAFTGFNAFALVRQGNYLFMHGVYTDTNTHTDVYRYDVSGVDFRPSTHILTQPQTNVNLIVGSTLNLSVVGIGTNVTYQWRFNGTNINSATTNTYSLANVQTNNSGAYTLVATGDRGTVTSAVSTVTIVQRIEGRYDITYNNPQIAGSTFILPDSSMIDVSLGTIFKMTPDGTRTNTRVIANANFPTSLVDSSNRVVLGGTLNGNRVTRIFASDLTDDAGFHQLTADNAITTVTELPGRGYLVGGFFTTVTNAGISTNAVSRICLIDYTGVVDTNFSVGTGPNGQVLKIVVTGGTNIYVGGSWSLWNNNSSSSFAKITTNGSLDSGFSYLAVNGQNYFDPYVSGKLFVLTQGKPIIVNPDGLRDASFNASNTTFNPLNSIKSIAVGESNKVYIVGSFTAYGSTSCGKYICLLANGNVDTNFDCSFVPTQSSTFSWVSYDPRGYVYLTKASTGGSFQGQSFNAGPYRLFAGGSTSASGFDSWTNQFTFPPGQSGPQADADGDGIPNVFEYYFGSNPTNSVSGAKPAEITVISGGQNYPALTFIRSKTTPGVTLIPQAAGDATFSILLGTTVESIVDQGNGTERVTIRSTTTVAARPSQFLRILLSIP